MKIFIIFLVVVATILLETFIEEYAWEKYKVNPTEKTYAGGIALPFYFMFISFIFDEEKSMHFLLIATGLVILAEAVYIYKKTDFLVAFLATIVNTIKAITFALLFFLIVAKLLESKE